MLPSRLNLIGLLLFIGASILLNGCANAQPPIASKTPPSLTSQPIISQVTLAELVRTVENRPIPLVATGFNGAFGLMNQFSRDGDGCQSLSIAIYPSASLAQQKFKADTSRRSYLLPSIKVKVGDDFLPMVLSEKQRRSAGETGEVRSGGMVYMRKNNVLLSFSWRGGIQGAVAYARKVEQALNKPEISTVSRSLNVPVVNISNPDSVEVGTTTKISYQVQNEVVVSAMQEQFPKWIASGEISFFTRTVGKQKVQVEFLTKENLVVPVSFTVNVVPKAVARLSSWTWPGSRLYFKSGQVKNGASTKSDNSEWIELNPSTFERIEDEQRVIEVKKVLGTLLQSKWQAPQSSIQVFNDHSTVPATQVYFCTYKVGYFNVACWGNLIGKSSLYIDSPLEKNTIPQLATIINWKEIKRRNAEKNLVAAPDAEITSQAFKRLRALSVVGPWKPVNILLTRILLPEQVDFQFVGQ